MNVTSETSVLPYALRGETSPVVTASLAVMLIALATIAGAWFFQLVIFLSGMERIRRFIDFCGPVVYVVMFALAIWMLWQTGFSSLSEN